MSNIDKQAVQTVADLKAGYILGHADVAILNELARIALASLEAEPVAYMHRSGQVVTREECCDDKTFAICCKVETPLYTIPPAPMANINPLLEFAREYIESWDLGMAGDSSLLASAKQAIADSSAQQLAPVSVPDELTREEYKRRFMEDDNFNDTFRGGWNACRAAMLQGAEPVTTTYKLPPHIFRELVNRLRDKAVKYQGCQQLREQLSRTLQEVIQPVAPQQEVK